LILSVADKPEGRGPNKLLTVDITTSISLVKFDAVPRNRPFKNIGQSEDCRHLLSLCRSSCSVATAVFS